MANRTEHINPSHIAELRKMITRLGTYQSIWTPIDETGVACIYVEGGRVTSDDVTKNSTDPEDYSKTL